MRIAQHERAKSFLELAAIAWPAWFLWQSVVDLSPAHLAAAALAATTSPLAVSLLLLTALVASYVLTLLVAELIASVIAEKTRKTFPAALRILAFIVCPGGVVWSLWLLWDSSRYGFAGLRSIDMTALGFYVGMMISFSGSLVFLVKAGFLCIHIVKTAGAIQGPTTRRLFRLPTLGEARRRSPQGVEVTSLPSGKDVTMGPDEVMEPEVSFRGLEFQDPPFGGKPLTAIEEECGVSLKLLSGRDPIWMYYTFLVSGRAAAVKHFLQTYTQKE